MTDNALSLDRLRAKKKTVLPGHFISPMRLHGTILIGMGSPLRYSASLIEANKIPHLAR